MDILLRATEATVAEPYLAPDLVWSPQDGWADFALTTGPRADLQANQSLFTAIVICLFTDAQATAAEAVGMGDRRGWWGDTIDLEQGEAPLGSKLWLLMRAPLTDRTPNLAVTYTKAGLAPLVASGAVGRFVVDAKANILQQRLELLVSAYAPNGAQLIGTQFGLIWSQIFK